MKHKIYHLHKKFPFIDPFINLLLGAFLGAFVSRTVNDICDNWHFWDSISFWISIGIFIVAIIYLAKFSSYSNAKNGKIEKAKEDLSEAMIKTVTKVLTKSTSIDELIKQGKKAKAFIDTWEDKEEKR